MASIKTNYVLNLITVISGLIFPLITFPYSSRILFADGIGLVQFYESIIYYIQLFAALGIPLYAVREISRCKHDPELMARTTVEILLLHCCMTVIAYAVVFTLVYFHTVEDVGLFMLLSSSIFLYTIGVPWFYQGIEDFKYITIRALVVRVLSVVALFVFVHTKDDLFNYAVIHVAAAAGNYLFNFFRLRKYIPRYVASFRQLRILRHLKPTLRIYVLDLIANFYPNLAPIMLGYLSDASAVGFYAASLKLTKMAMGVIVALNTVILPRFSFLFSQGEITKFYQLGNKALHFIYAISFPLAVGIGVLARPLMLLFCGASFEPSILVTQILAPTVIMINISALLGVQMLYPQNREHIVILCTTAVIVLRVALDFILIPRYAQTGAAITTLITDTVLVLALIVFGRRYLKLEYLKYCGKYLAASAVMLLPLYAIMQLGYDYFTTIFLSCAAGVTTYALCLYVLKDSLFMEMCDLVLGKMKNFRK
ncbi:flippase [uncultured Alistipes sp.]|nr:flippase [uncultured Alistipes sp.]